jgi:hypothetical protein
MWWNKERGLAASRTPKEPVLAGNVGEIFVMLFGPLLGMPLPLLPLQSKFVFSTHSAKLRSFDQRLSSISGSIGSGGTINGSGEVISGSVGMAPSCGIQRPRG